MQGPGESVIGLIKPDEAVTEEFANATVYKKKR